MNLRHFLLFWILLICSGYIFSQTNTNNELIANQQVWIDFYPHYKVNEKLEYYGDLGYRTTLNNGLWSRIYTRPSLRYHLNKKWEIHGGLGFFYIYNNTTVANRFEITPWQGVQLNWPRWDRLKFSNSFKLEERTSFNTDNWSSSFELRIRLKIAGRIEFNNHSTDKFWFIPFYVEGFASPREEINEIIRNKGRAGLGFGLNSSKALRFSFIANWQSSRSGLSNDFQITDIAYQLKVRFFWKNKLINKEKYDAIN